MWGRDGIGRHWAKSYIIVHGKALTFKAVIIPYVKCHVDLFSFAHVAMILMVNEPITICHLTMQFSLLKDIQREKYTTQPYF